MKELSQKHFSDRVMSVFIVIFVMACLVVCVGPFLNIIALSLSSNEAIVSQKVFLLPVDFTLNTYKNVLMDASISRSFLYTVTLTLVYTAISLFMTVCAAYPLTRKTLKGRSFFLILILVTMYFSGGIIPDYLLVSRLNLTDTMWSLILPSMISVFNLLVLKSFFTSTIPESLLESAKIDGCSDIGILIKIVLPLSLPVLATLCLFYAVWRWNTFQDARFYINDTKQFPLQLKLYLLFFESSSTDASLLLSEGNSYTASVPEAIKAACVVVATVPILLVYPWLQKYFVSGMTIGAVKG